MGRCSFVSVLKISLDSSMLLLHLHLTFCFSSLMAIPASYVRHARATSRRSWSSFVPRLISTRAMRSVLSLRAGQSLQSILNRFSVLEWIKCFTFSIKVSLSSALMNTIPRHRCASREGHVHIVQELLSRGANVNAATKVGHFAQRGANERASLSLPLV